MRAIDTNILVRLLTRDDPRQAASADRFVERGAWVPLVALAESVGVLASVYGLSARKLIAAIEMLLDHKELTLQDADVVGAALDLYREKPVLGFSDCLILAAARRAGHLPLGTFDRALAKIEGTHKL